MYRKHDIDVYKDTHKHTSVPTDMMLSIGEMHQNGIQYHAPPDDPDSFVSLLLIVLCSLT